MPIVNELLQQEMQYITKPFELKHIEGLFENGDELMQEIAISLIKGNNSQVDVLTKKALSENYAANTILDDGLIAGMAVVGIKFRDNFIFVPEVLIAARAMKAGMAHIEPILSASGVEPIGTVIMGTVKGDLHDIGKNLCIMMLRGAGFIVHDLGVDTAPGEFIDAIDEHQAEVLGMSALLTTTMPNMGKTIEYFEEVPLSQSNLKDYDLKQLEQMVIDTNYPCMIYVNKLTNAIRFYKISSKINFEHIETNFDPKLFIDVRVGFYMKESLKIVFMIIWSKKWSISTI